MTDRKTVSTINDIELTALYDQLDALRAVSRGYCPACGRGDAAPTVAEWETERHRAEQAEDASRRMLEQRQEMAAERHAWQERGDRAEAERDGAYRERAQLVAHFAALYPSHIGRTDPGAPDWPVLIVETPTGQMSWHIAERDLDLFGHVQPTGPEHRGWDGHTTEEKYERLRALTAAPRSAEAAIARVRQLADEYASSDPRWRPLARETAKVLHAALAEPAPAPDTAAAQATDGHACSNCEGEDPDTCLMNADRRPLRLTDLGRGVLAHVAGVTVAPAEHCGHLSPQTLLTTPPTECVLRPGHQGSHADHQGARWWPIAEQQPVDTAHRYCILCGNHSQPDHTCDPAGLGEMYGSLATLAETAHERAEQLASTLREVLDVIAHRGPVAADPLDVARWRAVLNPPKEQR